MSPTLLRFIKYSTVGFSTFLLDLVLLFVLVEWFLLSHVLAAGVAFSIAVSINYILSRRYVFKSTLRGVRVGYLNFLVIAFAGLLMVTGSMYFLTTVWHLHFMLARITVAVVTGFWNYLMNLYVNFKVAGRH